MTRMAKFECKDGDTTVVIHPEHALLVQGKDENDNLEPVVLFEVGRAGRENARGWKMKQSMQRCHIELDMALNWKPAKVEITKGEPEDEGDGGEGEG